jgi:hypothetical protein
MQKDTLLRLRLLCVLNGHAPLNLSPALAGRKH